MRFLKSNLAMHHARRLSHPNYPMSQPVRITISISFAHTFMCHSHTYHQARPLYSCCHHSNVQDPCIELFDHGVQFECAVSRRDQIWRLPDHRHGDVDVRLLSMYIPCQGNILFLIAPPGLICDSSLLKNYPENVHWAIYLIFTSCYRSSYSLHSISHPWYTLPTFLTATRSQGTFFPARCPSPLIIVLFSRRGPIDLKAKFEPSLLNTAIYLLGLSQQVSTFTINFQVGQDHVG